MERDEALKRIRVVLPGLRANYGLRSIALFGSVARNEGTPGSDIDLLIEFEPDRVCGFFTLFKLQKELEAALGAAVDLVTRDALKRQLKASILAEAIDAA